MSFRCPACGNEIPPEYPPEEYPYCMFCSAPLGAPRPLPSLETDREAPVYPPAYSPEPLAARLILESGLGKVEYPLDAPVVTIGRSRSNDISLEDARVSRHHARIVRGERGYLIEDLNSRNGTRVDDRAVRDSQPLTDGAIVRIGDTVFRFVVTGGGGGRGAVEERRPPEPSIPVLFLAPWTPVQCPVCQGMRTMRPVVYGDAARTPAAQAAARRGEIALGNGPVHPNAPNAECRACGTRVRIVQTSG